MSFIKTGSPEPIHIIKTSEELDETTREKLEQLKEKVEKNEEAEKN